MSEYFINKTPASYQLKYDDSTHYLKIVDINGDSTNLTLPQISALEENLSLTQNKLNLIKQNITYNFRVLSSSSSQSSDSSSFIEGTEILSFSKTQLGIDIQCEFDIINEDGYNITTDSRISRRWYNDNYLVSMIGGWESGEYKLKSKTSNIKTYPLSNQVINSTAIQPYNNVVYFRLLESDDAFTFETPTDINQSISFRLYLIMPDPVVSFTLPLNIQWNDEPDFTSESSLYMFVFEWNPILNKWLGNQMWQTISVDLNNIQDLIQQYSPSSSSYSSQSSNSQNNSVLVYTVSGLTGDYTSYNGNYYEVENLTYKNENNIYLYGSDYGFWGFGVGNDLPVRSIPQMQTAGCSADQVVTWYDGNNMMLPINVTVVKVN